MTGAQTNLNRSFRWGNIQPADLDPIPIRSTQQQKITMTAIQPSISAMGR
jgi:hypothetical protein